MSDSKTLKQLQKKLGTEVSQNQTLVAMGGEKNTQVKEEFLQLLHSRNIPDTEIDTATFLEVYLLPWVSFSFGQVLVWQPRLPVLECSSS